VHAKATWQMLRQEREWRDTPRGHQIYPPGTVLTEAAVDLLDKLGQSLGSAWVSCYSD